MPAIITHDTFGRDVYGQLYTFIGGTKNETDAFLLGNQGPDPLFYAAVNPRLGDCARLGSLMHAEHTGRLLASFKQAVNHLPVDQRPIGRAYCLGFLCHYLLDSTAHPFIYAQEYELCDAGEPGLDRSNGSDVHAVIESELGELVLTVKRQRTLDDFNPAQDILKASDTVLDIISQMYAYVALDVYGLMIPADGFKAAVKAFRRVQAIFYSPNGVKRAALGAIETKLRPYSFIKAMSHRNTAVTESDFDNRDHNQWANPYTEEVSTASFFDLYNQALTQAASALSNFDAPSFDVTAARSLTHDANFSGCPCEATILAVEDSR